MNDALQTFLILITDLKHLSACACSRISGDNDGTKRGWEDERKRKRGKEGKMEKGSEVVKRETVKCWERESETLEKTNIYHGIAGNSPNESRF